MNHMGKLKNRTQIKGEQWVKDNTTNNYKEGGILKVLQQIMLLHVACGQTGYSRADSGIRYRDDNMLIRFVSLWFCIQLEEDAVYFSLQ